MEERSSKLAAKNRLIPSKQAMTVIESEAVLNQPVELVYNFLQDFNNHQRLMPSNIQNWKSTTDEASFSIENMVSLSLEINERIENKLITILPIDNTSLNIKLGWKLDDVGKGTKVQYYIHADLNMMMKMIAHSPLKKLAEHQVKRLKELLV